MGDKLLIGGSTEELEVLEFIVAGNSYGINVAKIKEIITYQPVTPVPNAHPSIEGIFMPRDTMITAIDLSNCLQRGESKPGGLFIVTSFNSLDIAFHVKSVLDIHRVSWEHIMKPGAVFTNSDEEISTGVINVNGKLIIILDFEKIVADINPEIGMKFSEIDMLGTRNNNDVPILIAEDSLFLNRMIKEALLKAGYTHVTICDNGQEAWDILCTAKERNKLDEVCKCLITDIEMPLMDGHKLLKLIREDSAMANLPVIIFSSLINDEMKAKGKALGANASLSKPEIGDLVAEVDALVK